MGWICVRCAFNGELWFPAKTFTGDLVLVNRGFTVQESMGVYCAEVKAPAITGEKAAKSIGSSCNASTSSCSNSCQKVELLGRNAPSWNLRQSTCRRAMRVRYKASSSKLSLYVVHFIIVVHQVLV